MRTLANDPVLKPMIRVITPTQSLLGIAGNFSGGNDAAKTFLGVGVIPSNQQRMRQWNEYGVAEPFVPDTRHGRRRTAAWSDRRRHGAHPRSLCRAEDGRLPRAPCRR